MKMLQLNQIHLQAINKVICVLEFLGFSLWRVKVKSFDEIVVFSYRGLLVSMLIVFVIVYATISQLWTKIPVFETANSKDITKIIQLTSQYMIYSTIPVIFVPVWILHRKISLIFSKLLKINKILSEINRDISNNFFSASNVISIFLWILGIIVITALDMIFGIAFHKIHINRGIDWNTFIAYAMPSLFKHIFVLHFITLMSALSTRLTHIYRVLEGIN